MTLDFPRKIFKSSAFVEHRIRDGKLDGGLIGEITFLDLFLMADCNMFVSIPKPKLSLLFFLLLLLLLLNEKLFIYLYIYKFE
jgi:hypothetical protein